MKIKEKVKCIIDTDPGVDDAAAILLSLYDDLMDIKLITTVSGNLDLKTVTRNMLHILEKFDRTDIPVVMGADKPMTREPKDAKFIHQNDGLGGYVPPKEVSTKPLNMSAVDAMYETIKHDPNNVVIIALGPHTNVAYLIQKYPEVKKMIKHIYCEGCAPYDGVKETHISFNVSSDPEAFQIVLDSGIPITMIPSRMGRELANFNEQEIYYMKDLNDTGRFLFEMYSGYWEPRYADRRIAINDTCACLILRYPHLFKTKRTFFEVNKLDMPGKTTITFNRKGNVNYAYKVNRKKLHKLFFAAIKKMDRFKFYSA